MCKYCKTTHKDGLQAGADFGDGKDLFRLINTGRLAARREGWDFALHSVKIKFCPMCGTPLGAVMPASAPTEKPAEIAEPPATAPNDRLKAEDIENAYFKGKENGILEAFGADGTRTCAQWSEKADLAHGIIDEYGKLSGLNNKSIQTWVRVEQMCRNYAEGAKE